MVIYILKVAFCESRATETNRRPQTVHRVGESAGNQKQLLHGTTEFEAKAVRKSNGRIKKMRFDEKKWGKYLVQKK